MSVRPEDLVVPIRRMRGALAIEFLLLVFGLAGCGGGPTSSSQQSAAADSPRPRPPDVDYADVGALFVGVQRTGSPRVGELTQERSNLTSSASGR